MSGNSVGVTDVMMVKYLRTANEQEQFHFNLCVLDAVLKDIELNSKCSFRNEVIAKSVEQGMLTDNTENVTLESNLKTPKSISKDATETETETEKFAMKMMLQYGTIENVVLPIHAFCNQASNVITPKNDGSCKFCCDTDYLQTQLLTNATIWRKQIMAQYT